MASFSLAEAQIRNVSEVGCYGGHQDSENDPCPRSSTQPEIDCFFCCVGAGASRKDR